MVKIISYFQVVMDHTKDVNDTQLSPFLWQLDYAQLQRAGIMYIIHSVLPRVAW